MGCKHERLRTIGNQVFCCGCGEELPLEFLLNAGKRASKAEEEPKQGNPAPKKRTAKKADKA